MTTGRKKKSRKKVASKAKARKKSGAKSAASETSGSAAEPANGGFVILLDDPDPEDEQQDPLANEKCIRLRSDCVIDEVSGIRQRLLNSYGSGQPIVIDLEAVDKVDTAFLQLLCSMARKAREDGIPLRFEKHSASIIESAALLGLSGVLDCDE